MNTTLWRSAQAAGLGLTAVLLVGLVQWPTMTLEVLWTFVVPLLPAAFLINPALWRNVCPLATLNMIGPRHLADRPRSQRFAAAAAPLGLILLALMVPARRFLFNNDGLALAGTILLVALAALLMGFLFDAKAGFCNAFCPVLPVERLYGQAPLVELSNPRCPDCSWCSRGCLDIAPQKAVPASLGRSRRSHRWLITPFGIFAAAFPGFVLGYFLTTDGPIGSAGRVYLVVFAAAAASWCLSASMVTLLGIASRSVLPVLAAAAVALYYWFTWDVIAASLSLPAAAGVLKAVTLVLIGAWLWRALVRARTRPAFHVPEARQSAYPAGTAAQ